MRRVRYHEYGDPDVLTVEEADVPEPGPGQVLIRAEAIGTNFVDTLIRRGPASPPLFRRPLPGRPTGDVVGTVEAVGPGVGAELVGRRYAGTAEDAYAAYAVSDAEWAVPVPDGLDAAAACMLPLAAPVALGSLRHGRLAPGETVLVHAAAGGIGHHAVQLARLLGAGTVIATASSPARLDFARDYGADAGVDYSVEGWQDRVREVAPGGVDLVLDSVGGDVLLRSFDVLAPAGRVLVYGAASGELGRIPVTSLFGLRSAIGFALYDWRAAAPDRARAEQAEVIEWSAAGRLRTATATSLPLTEAARAHVLLESRTHLGRVLLIP
jgi:NADPH2:quinone reductase